MTGIPDQVYREPVAIVGRTGSGKSFTARGAVERLLVRQCDRRRPGRRVRRRSDGGGAVTVLAILVYLAAIVAANLLVAQYGPAAAPINAFLLIGLDLSLRDLLQTRLRPWRIGALILASGVIAWLIDPAAQRIAIASAVAFIVSAGVDWLVFVRTPGSWTRRSLASNTVGAAVDSIIFPTLAFGALLPEIVVLQFVAKTVGSALWTAVLRRWA